MKEKEQNEISVHATLEKRFAGSLVRLKSIYGEKHDFWIRTIFDKETRREFVVGETLGNGSVLLQSRIIEDSP